MRLILIDPLLKNESGHQYSHAAALIDEIGKRGVSCVTLGSASGDENCRRLPGFIPALTDVSGFIFQESLPALKLGVILNRVRLLRSQFESFFLKSGGEEDVYFFHSPYIFELISFAWFLRKKRRNFSALKNFAFIGFNFNWRRKTVRETAIFVFLFRWVSALLGPCMGRVIFFSFHEPTARDYAGLLNRQVLFLPPPALTDKLRTSSAEVNKQNKSRLVVTYVGGARQNKSFDRLAEFIRWVKKDERLKSKVEFVIQVNIQDYQIPSEKNTVERAVADLQLCSREFSGVSFVYGAVEMEKYYALIAESDVILILHREEFKDKSSNIFFEAVAMGKIPLTSEVSLMAQQLSGAGLGRLVVRIDEPQSFVDALAFILSDRDMIREKIERLSKELASENTVGNLVDRLLSLLNQRLAPVIIPSLHLRNKKL
jgi:glycosyltransferase involved in cell wall biosynthesis